MFWRNKREMKAEAISRMKAIGLYNEIIEDFDKNGTPQVYEPPYGASYSLEDDELKTVRSFEKDRKVLIWGVIRSFMEFNRKTVTVDCMLYVSNDKDNWVDERRDLLDGIPIVLTIMKDPPYIKDHGSICIYMSEGGTPLRKTAPFILM